MKRISILALTLVFALMLGMFAVSADNVTSLIPKDANWTDTDNGGASVDVTYNDDGSVVFSGSTAGTWPCTETWYLDTPVVADVENDSLEIDFTVSGGNTNINFFFDDGNGGSYSYTVCNSALGAENYDTGSGDIGDGTYKVTMTIAELVASTKLIDGSAFPQDAIRDGQLKFIGIQVYSVNGAVITVNAMNVISAGETTPSESTGEDTSDEPVADNETHEIFVSHVNHFCWNAYREMIITGEGQNCQSVLEQAVDSYIAIRVENIDGVYTVTDIEAAGTVKEMTAPADGFILYCAPNDTESFAAAEKVVVGDVVLECTVDWSANVASETAVGSLVFGTAGASTESSGDTSSTGKPATGDSGILVFVALAAVAGAGVLVATKKRQF